MTTAIPGSDTSAPPSVFPTPDGTSTQAPKEQPLTDMSAFAVTLRTKPLPEISAIRAIYSYDPETGFFYALHNRTGERVRADTVAGQGYRQLQGRGLPKLLAHRAAFALMHDRWPHMIDHINGIRDDNRWTNLREVTATENQANRATYRHSRYRSTPRSQAEHWPRTVNPYPPRPLRPELPPLSLLHEVTMPMIAADHVVIDLMADSCITASCMSRRCP